MAKQKLIYVSQEIVPYLSVTDNAVWGRALPLEMQSRKYEVRTFMPDYGEVNERRNQLHEVIRLSGLNIEISKADHPLVVKVASMHPTRIQVYFIDNDDYFQRLATDSDAFGSNRPDNDERLVFFTRGTMETAAKLQWNAAVMHAAGWMASLTPLYLRRLFSGAESFAGTKMVYTLLPETKIDALSPGLFDKLETEGIPAADLEPFRAMKADHNLLHKMGIAFSDAVTFQTETPDPELVAWAEQCGKPWLHITGDGTHADEYESLYKQLTDPQ